jgi:hypothetical protein
VGVTSSFRPECERADDDPEFRFDPLLQAVDPKIKQAITYWQEKRGARIAPARSEIDLREVKSFLSHLQIFDVIDGGRAYRPRLMGTSIVRQIKEDATGQVFDDSSPRPVVHRVLSAVRWVVAHKKPLRTVATRTALENRDFLSHETLFLPLSTDGSVIDMLAVVGVFSPAST